MQVTIVCPRCHRSCQVDSSLLTRNLVCPYCNVLWPVAAPATPTPPASPVGPPGINAGQAPLPPIRRKLRFDPLRIVAVIIIGFLGFVLGANVLLGDLPGSSQIWAGLTLLGWCMWA
jgi:hypothetical protein